MTRYALSPVPPIAGGQGARDGVGAILASLGAGPVVLLVADPGLASAGLIDEMRGLIVKTGREAVVFSAFASDPTIAATDAAAALAREAGAGVVVGLGGGSALDLGKAAAAVTAAPGSAVDYELCKRDFPEQRLPFIAVPTTSGTGSELTRTSVLTRADKAKVWLWGDRLRAAHVILDPELTVSLPPELTAATGLDALVHAVEAATNRNATPANNLYAHEAIRLVARHLERAVADGRDLIAREALQRAAALAGIAIDNAGTAIAHNVGHALASLAPIHHGRAVALAMLATNPWNLHEDDGRFAQCAMALGEEASARGFLSGYERLVRATGIKASLDGAFAGLAPETLAAQMARPENAAMRNSNWRASSEADLLALAGAVLAVS